MGRSSPHALESINYSFVPNRRVTMEALCQTRLSGAEFRAVILIMNQTNGYLREEDIIRPQFFEDKACLSRDNLRRVLGRLRGWNIVSKNKRAYRILPPDQWAQDVFLEKRVKNDTVKKRVRNDTPTVSNLTHPPGEIDTLLACSKENYSKENILKNTGFLKKTRTRKSAPADPRVKTILDAISQELEAQIPFYAKEGAAVKRALQMGYTEEQIIGCWRRLKGFAFWQGKWLPLAKVTENIGEFVAGRLIDGQRRDSSGKAPPRRAPVHGAEDFESGKW